MSSVLLPRWLFVCVFGLVAAGTVVTLRFQPTQSLVSATPRPTLNVEALPSPTPVPTPPSTPTPKPLTFAELNNLYGPCVSLPILMYHHVQAEDQAKAAKQTSLSVYTPIFREQMQYLKDQGYTTITPADLKHFFDDKTSLPAKPVLLTFDDGYADLYTDMWPVLKELEMKSTVFMITGLADNPGYLSWNQISEMAQNGIYFGNHTWSHHNMKAVLETIQKEVGTAETQLQERSLNAEKIFAYPFGLMSPLAINYLTTNGYSLAFDTVSGRVQCTQKKYELTRIRIGNTKLSAYGL